MRCIVLLAAVAACTGHSVAARAETAPREVPTEAAGSQSDQDLDRVAGEPDFTVITMPTNLRLPKHRVTFRLTHRFGRPLGEGDLGSLASDMFGLDGGAQVGLGLRFGVRRGNQLAAYRTGDRTIQLSDQQELVSHERRAFGLSLVVSIEGRDNMGLSDAPVPEPLHTYSPSAALVLSRRLGSHGALYVVPSFVANTRITPSAPGNEDSTAVLGLGARLFLRRNMAIVGEAHPRLFGYRGDLGAGDAAFLAAFGVEWTVGGHAFQLNVSNDLGTTPAQVARGQQGSGWHLGLNLSRKFY